LKFLLSMALLAVTASGQNLTAVRCGTPDDTAAIQTALNSGKPVLLPPGICVVQPLYVRGDTVIEFHPKTVLQSKAGYVEGQSLLNIVDVSNVTIRGNGGAIRMNKGEYTSGDQRHGLLIKGSSEVRIYDLTSAGSGGDGFYIGNGKLHSYSSNIALYNCTADNNRRNGLSVVSGRNVLVAGGEFRNSIGTLPESGIDIEPNVPTDRVENVSILDLKTHDNHGGGITVAPYALGAAEGNSISLNIHGVTSRNDSKIAIGGGIRLTMPDPPFALAHDIGGRITISDVEVKDPNSWGVSVSRWVSKAPRVVFQKVTVYNPNATGRGRADFGWSFKENAIAANSGFVVAVTPADEGSQTQRVEFLNCRAWDQRNKPRMLREFYIHSSAPAKRIDVFFANF